MQLDKPLYEIIILFESTPCAQNKLELFEYTMKPWEHLICYFMKSKLKWLSLFVYAF